MTKEQEKKLNKLCHNLKVAQKHKALARYYNINSILGNDWAIFYAIVGARKTGKSYAVADWLANRKAKLKDQCKNYWLRISEMSVRQMLANNAEKLIDPDLVRKYDLHFKTKGYQVFDVKEKDGKIISKESWIECIPLSAMGKMKGVGFYDKDFMGEYNIILDEFQLEVGEKRTSFDILYNFIGMCENIARTTKKKIHVFMLGNNLSEASEVLKAFSFIPDKFGRFYLKSKKCVIDNIEPTDEYMKDREGSIADILGGNDMSNYTNVIKKDFKYISKKKPKKVKNVIKFSKEPSNWYLLWEGNIITRYKKIYTKDSYVINMIPYLDGYFNKEPRDAVIKQFDTESFRYDSLITYTYFKEELTRLRK